MYLPASGKPVTEDKTKKATAKAGHGKILFMDDEEVVRRATRRLLESAGYTGVMAADGDEAVRLYEEARAAGEPFDVVMLDLTIPGGMGGKETLDVLKELDPDVKAIVASGYSNDPVVSEYREFGFKASLTKPFDLEDLADVLARVLGS
jgi:CheY-like chemotaxis protein